MFNKRLCEIPYNKEEFHKIKNTYEEALDRSVFKNNKLDFQIIKAKKKNRKRKIIYF